MPSKQSLKERFVSKIKKSKSGCWEWTRAKNSDGYGRFSYKGKNVLAHRISYFIFSGIFPQDVHVLHQCDNRGCVNPNHLFIGNHLTNMKDMKKKGRIAKGEKSHKAKLSEEEVKAMRDLYELRDVKTHRDLAKIFRIVPSQVCYILNRKQWKNLEGSYA